MIGSTSQAGCRLNLPTAGQPLSPAGERGRGPLAAFRPALKSLGLLKGCWLAAGSCHRRTGHPANRRATLASVCIEMGTAPARLGWPIKEDPVGGHVEVLQYSATPEDGPLQIGAEPP